MSSEKPTSMTSAPESGLHLLYGGNATAGDGSTSGNESSASHHHQWVLSESQVTLSVTALVFLFFLSLFANLGIIFYERVVSDIYRTLLNKLAALASLYQLGLTMAMIPVLVFRLLWGDGLGFAVCMLQTLLFVFFLVQFVLTYNELILLRFIFVCKLHTIGMLKEDVILCCVIWINMTLGSFVCLTTGIVLHSPSHVYFHYCKNSATGDGKYICDTIIVIHVLNVITHSFQQTVKSRRRLTLPKLSAQVFSC